MVTNVRNFFSLVGYSEEEEAAMAELVFFRDDLVLS
jgi:hypothetical protein